MKVTVLIFLYSFKRELQFWAGAPKTVIRISNLAKFTPPPQWIRLQSDSRLAVSE